MLIATAVFDPSDLILHLKVPIFVATWMIFCVYAFAKKNVYISMRLTMYVAIFTFILPLLSIFYYILTNGDFEPYDGFQYFKSYLFLSILVILYGKKIDLIKPFSIILTVLSVIIIFVAIAASYMPLVYEYLRVVGFENNFFHIGERNYGGQSFYLSYYVTSPLLVMSIAYFTYLSVNSMGSSRVKYIAIVLINCVAMFLSGTRNNILCSILVPILVLHWYTKKKALFMSLLILIGLAVIFQYGDVIKDMLSPEDVSNAAKIGMVEDYIALFSNFEVLLFGQGLGSYFYFPSRGYMSVTELTYFEFIRNYGLVGAGIFFFLLAYPLKMLLLKAARKDHYIYLAYLVYLGICISNPLLISSTGMLVLAIVLYKVFAFQNNRQLETE